MAPADDYDDLTVDDVKERVREGQLLAAAALEYERDHKDRVTLTSWLEGRLPPADADDGHETVTVAAQRVGSIAGFYFERAHATRTVDRNPRVEEAISDGDLRVIEP